MDAQQDTVGVKTLEYLRSSYLRSPVLWIPLLIIAALLYRDYVREQDLVRMCQLLDKYNITDGWYDETTLTRDKMDAICLRYSEERN